MQELRMSANIYGTPMEILVYGCTLEYEEYLSVYSDVYGSDRLANILYIPYDELKNYYFLVCVHAICVDTLFLLK